MPGGVIAAALVPHPPILVPEVGGHDSQRAAATAVALRRLDQLLVTLNAQAFLLVSPHSPGAGHQIMVRRGPRLSGDLARFHAPQARLELQVDAPWTEALLAQTSDAGLRVGVLDDDVVDHGAVVPLLFLRRALGHLPAVVTGVADWEAARLQAFGRVCHQAAQRLGLRVVLLASGDLSHCLLPQAPVGYRPEGPQFDRLVVDALRAGATEPLTTMSRAFILAAGECGLRPLQILVGAAQSAGLRSRVWSYEGPFGVGYCVAPFLAEDPAPA